MDELPALARTEVGPTLVRPDSGGSIRQADAALKAARLDSRPDSVAIALVHLAHLHFRQGRYGQTRMLAEEVLRDAPPDSQARCDALRMLGNCAAELGDPDRAEEYYHQAVDLARQLDDGHALYACLHSLATNIYWPRGQFDLCLAAGKAALAQARALDLGEEIWFPLADIGWAYWSTGQLDLARQTAHQIEQVVTPGSLGDGFNLCLRAGLAAPGAGHLEAVLPLYERARQIAEATGDPGLSVDVRLGLCRAHRAAGNLPAANTWAEDAVTVSVRLKYRQFEGLALIERGRTRIDMGDFAGAELDLREALRIASELRSRFDQARASLYLAALLAARHRPEAGAAWQQVAQLVGDHGYAFLVEQERSLVLPWIAVTLDAGDPLLAATSGSLLEILANVPPDPLQVRTLGQFSLQIGPDQVSKERLRQRRAGELLALLVSSPGCTRSAGQVAEAMCPEKDPRAAVDFYHHATSALRRMLEPDLPDRRFRCRYLDVSEERVTLVVAPGSRIDFVQFEQYMSSGDWEGALRIYQGEFLPAFQLAEWTVPQRQHLGDQFERALLSMAAEQLRSGAAAACLDTARRALLHNPWQEQAVLLGMRAALDLGDRVTAIRLYQRLEKTLERDLGIAPEEALQQLHAEARRRPRGEPRPARRPAG